jgi:hypothetical protein
MRSPVFPTVSMLPASNGLWAYNLGSDAWNLYRTDPNPGFHVGSDAGLDPGATR